MSIDAVFYRCVTESRSLYRAASSGPNFLYTTEHNYMDFNVDDNGLWVIYSTADSNNTHVAKVSVCNVHLHHYRNNKFIFEDTSHIFDFFFVRYWFT